MASWRLRLKLNSEEIGGQKGGQPNSFYCINGELNVARGTNGTCQISGGYVHGVRSTCVVQEEVVKTELSLNAPDMLLIDTLRGAIDFDTA